MVLCDRFNFGVGNHEEHQAVLERVRKVAAERKSTVALMLDTRGPEVYTSKLRGGQLLDLLVWKLKLAIEVSAIVSIRHSLF